MKEARGERNGSPLAFFDRRLRRLAMTELLKRITVEAGKCGGRPCIRGTGALRVVDVLELLSAGVAVCRRSWRTIRHYSEKNPGGDCLCRPADRSLRAAVGMKYLIYNQLPQARSTLARPRAGCDPRRARCRSDATMQMPPTSVLPFPPAIARPYVQTREIASYPPSLPRADIDADRVFGVLWISVVSDVHSTVSTIAAVLR